MNCWASPSGAGRSKVASLFGLVPPAIVSAVRVPDWRSEEFFWRCVVERSELDRDVVTADLLYVAATERTHAAVAAEKMVPAPGAELVVAEGLFARKKAEGFRFDDDRPVPALGADRAVALAGAGAQVDIGFEANGTAVATACVCLHHA